MEERRTEACQFEKIIGVSDVSGGLLSLSAFGPLFGYQEPSFLPMFLAFYFIRDCTDIVRCTMLPAIIATMITPQIPQ